MVNSSSAHLDAIFTALSDPTRRAMLQRLCQGEQSVGTLSAPFELSKPAITKHLKMLERAGLLRREVVGREHRCSLEPRPLGDAAQWISFYERFWTDRLDGLQAYLAIGNPTDNTKDTK